MEGTGEKLYMALKLSGLSWGAKIGPNHIANNKRWSECKLPKSINTVNEDIRSGIPINRLDNYACFFQVLADIFIDEKIEAYSADFSCEILKNKHLSKIYNPLTLRIHDTITIERLSEQNTAKSLYDLHCILSGVYCFYVKSESLPSIQHGALLIGDQIDEGLQIAGTFLVDGVRIDCHGLIFRWHNFIHVKYYSSDYQMLGYLMTTDPLQSTVIRQRQPFYMQFFGLAGNLTLSMEPDRQRIWAVRQDVAEGQDPAAAYEAICETVIRESASDSRDTTPMEIFRWLSGKEG